MMKVTGLNCSPLKSAGLISLQEARVGRMGIRYDRQWMVVDEHGTFVAQRSNENGGIAIPPMCLIKPRFEGDDLVLSAPDIRDLRLPLAGMNGETVPLRVWKSPCEGVVQGDVAAGWITEYLSRFRPGSYRIVRMADDSHRTDKKGASELAYADGYPFLVISEASFLDLNARLPKPFPIDRLRRRFRATIVIDGCKPYAEDEMGFVAVGDMLLRGMTLCERCGLPNIDQDTGGIGKEPMKTLNRYRRFEGNVLFGHNFSHTNEGIIRVGDPVYWARGEAA